MNWFLIALIGPALWSVTNHLDKYLIGRYIKGGGIGALTVFSALIGLLVAPLIYVFNPQVIGVEPKTAFLIALNGTLYLVAIIPYFYALNKDEASKVVPLFQLIPVITYALAYFILGETLNNTQIVGAIFIIVGAVAISLELAETKNIRLKTEVFWLMLLASFIISINFTLFKYFALDVNFWTASFWEYVGFIFFGVFILAFVKSYRTEFVSLIQENKVPVLGLNGFNEVINIIGKLAFNFATLLAPITLIWVVNGLQPFFVFLYGILLTIFFPKISQENITKKHLAHKLIAIFLIFVGTTLIN